MNLAVNLLSLVLASTTGWVLLVFGALPISILRGQPREPLLAAGAWAVVAATAPQQVFHWYLIFAMFSLIACTKLNRPAGKVWLAVTAALGLSLGIIFPLEAVAPLLQHETPFRLALLYASGAVTALAYAIGVTGLRVLPDGWRPRGLARGFLIASFLWLALLIARRAVFMPSALPRVTGTAIPEATLQALNATLFGTAIVELLLAALIVRSVGRGTKPMLAVPACLLALAQSLAVQLLD
jgi:hypothetical protein